MKTDRELRVDATELIRDLNAVTGITTADQARRLNLHKANVSATINQGRVQNLGWQSIGSLLRMFGFEKGDDGIRIRDSEACPVIAPGPLDEQAKQAMGNLVARLRYLGLTCFFHAFVVNDEVTGDVERGGILTAHDEERVWACVSFTGNSHGELTKIFEELGCLRDAHRLPIRGELFDSWFDSPPHRSELLDFFEKVPAY